MKPLRVHLPTSYLALLWHLPVLLLCFAVMVWLGLGDFSFLLVFVYTQFIVWLTDNLGPIEMDEQGIRYYLRGRIYAMKWDEVKRVETGGGIVLLGEDKQMCVPPFRRWWGEDKAAMTQFFEAQLQQRGLPVNKTWKTQFRVSRGTKVAA